ncbi:MAG: hypothetical protein ACK4P4_24225 [Allorhizobium sp.]|nr:hypothetical protein SAMN05880561_107159 [Rhizobium sp. RU33A]
MQNPVPIASFQGASSPFRLVISVKSSELFLPLTGDPLLGIQERFPSVLLKV